jgi:hypothetical protein
VTMYSANSSRITGIHDSNLLEPQLDQLCPRLVWTRCNYVIERRVGCKLAQNTRVVIANDNGHRLVFSAQCECDRVGATI